MIFILNSGPKPGRCNRCNCTLCGSHCTLWRFTLHPVYLGYRSSPSLLPCLVDFIVNDFASYGILAWLRAWLHRGAQAIDILLIFSILDGTSSVRLKLCCTAALRLLIFSPLDGTSSIRLKLCCTAASRLLMFSSLDGTSGVRPKLFYIQALNPRPTGVFL